MISRWPALRRRHWCGWIRANCILSRRLGHGQGERRRRRTENWKKNGKVCVQSGVGIVADSVPEKEYDECRNKARAVLNALEEAEGGLP